MLTKPDIRIIKDIVDTSIVVAIDNAIETKIAPIIDEKIDHKLGVFMEHLDDQFERIMEAIQVIERKTEAITPLQEDIDTCRRRMTYAEADIILQERRLRQLENVT